MPEETEVKIDPEKYAVFKKQDLFEALVLLEALEEPVLEKVLDVLAKHLITDAFVLRQQDWLAVGGLYGYANHARTVAEVIEEFGDPFSQKRLPELHAIADYAMKMAEGSALDSNRKLPTI